MRVSHKKVNVQNALIKSFPRRGFRHCASAQVVPWLLIALLELLGRALDKLIRVVQS